MFMSVLNLQAGDLVSSPEALTRLVLLTAQAGECQQPQRGRTVPTGHEVFITSFRGEGVSCSDHLLYYRNNSTCVLWGSKHSHSERNHPEPKPPQPES